MNAQCTQHISFTVNGNGRPLQATKLQHSRKCRLLFYSQKKEDAHKSANVTRASSIVQRKTAAYHPSVWGEYFLTLEPKDKMVSSWTKQAEALKEKVREMLDAPADDHLQQLHLIDVLQRLGVGYLFEAEIEKILRLVYNSHNSYNNDDNLCTVALRFRILRQACYRVSSDIFNIFKDAKGKFKENLRSDVQGMLSLYEASFHVLPGEDILDETLAFAKSCLTSLPTQLDSPLSDHIRHALRRPMRRNVTKHEQLYYISYYELHEEAYNKSLLKLAKFNFNIIQNLYQVELRSLSVWWKDLNFKTKFPYSRDRLVECYFFALGAISEPEHRLARKNITKFAQLATIMDDTFDVYGTIEELEMFNQTIQRWDTSVKDLPDYMKPLFEALVDVIQEIGDESVLQGRPYCLNYARIAIQDLAAAYMTEARWLKEGYVPTLEEYRQVTGISTIYPSLVVAGLCGIGKHASKEVFEWLLTNPKLLTVLSDHCRIMDDVMTHEFEQKREHVVSSVECYMKQYGVSKKDAYDELNKLIENDWKDINEEIIKQDKIPKQIRMVFLNFARVMEVLFKDFDGYTLSEGRTKDMLTALLVTPMSI